MSDKYYRGLISSVDNVKNKLQLALITLKINENRNIISGIKNDISEINNFSDKINNNVTNISSNLSKINDNDNNINEIRTNLNNIKNDLTDFKINYAIQNLFIYNIDIEKNYTLNKDNPKFSIFSYNLEDDFKSNSILEVNCKILYNYTTYNNIGTLIHIFKLYDENNVLIYEYNNLKSNAGDNSAAFLNQRDMFYIKLNDNYSIIKIELILSILDNITKSVSCKLLNTFKSNFLYIKHYKKINTLSVNNNLTNLKNLFNIKYYDYKKEIKFNESFFNKTFNLDFKKNDFVDIDLKMKLEYENIDDSEIISTKIKLYNDINEEIFVTNYNNKDSISYSNFVFLNKNILYNFIEDTKFVKIIITFEFQQIKSIKKIHYIPTNNDRLYLKHYVN